MAMFYGGPYDGMELPIDPKYLKKIRLPPRFRLKEFLADQRMTEGQEWPYHYAADLTSDPPVYRFEKMSEETGEAF